MLFKMLAHLQNNNIMKPTLILIILIGALVSCDLQKTSTLPIIGDRVDLDGNKVIHSIRPFSFTNQLNETVTNKTYENKIHIVDFFFTSCPSICPLVTAQMKRIYNHVEEYGDVMLLSYTIDPKRDSIPVLKKYADNIDIDHNLWHFLRGDKDFTMELANEDYFIAALEAPDAPGGFDHSGKIILLDKQAKIRGFCDGTDPESITKFLKTIDQLRATYE